MERNWFEMNEYKKHKFDNKVWIPVYATQKLIENGDVGTEGYLEEYFECKAIIFPEEEKENLLNPNWLMLDASPDTTWVDDDSNFIPTTHKEISGAVGINIAVIQYIEAEKLKYVYPSVDFIVALKLRLEGDNWVCPDENYDTVIKIKRNASGNPVLVEIKAEYLKDFLCAAKAGLILTSFRSRKEVKTNVQDIPWDSEGVEEFGDVYKWSAHTNPVFEGPFPFDSSFHIFHVSRVDDDEFEDIPVYGEPEEDDVEFNSYELNSKETGLTQVTSKLWKKEWISAATNSTRVREDEIESKIEFVTDNSGTLEDSAALSASTLRWLWFKPSVITHLLNFRTGVLEWYTESTGKVGGAWNRSVDFGVNAEGYINVLAVDIAEMRETDKKLWASYNVSPIGKVSEELILSQMRATPAKTIAPEEVFFELVKKLQETSIKNFGGPLFKEHHFEEKLVKSIHRFHTVDLEGFYFLCKEITRYLIERIDIDLLKGLKNEKDTGLKSLKRIENILTALGYDGRSITTVLVGVNELRQADAHLPSSTKVIDSMNLTGVAFDELGLLSGKYLLTNVNASLEKILKAFEESDFSKLKSK